MKVEEGQRVEKGELLYMISTPELDAKLEQAEAVKSAAAALDAAAVAGARIQQIEAALNMWEKAQAGLELARKTYERVQNLYNEGVVPAQKFDEAEANYKAMEATALAAKHSTTWPWTRPQGGQGGRSGPGPPGRRCRERGAVVSGRLPRSISPVTGEVSTIIAEEGELVGSGYPDGKAGGSGIEKACGKAGCIGRVLL